ncbi:MAG: GIY-YIG nuclease family protein [Cytophagaceae bacterium]|nr:GIY-YIG nuclease family protein [Cytophagaceae bacterium]
MIAKGGYVYITSNKSRTILYTGVTSHLISRTTDHKEKKKPGFTFKYNCLYLIYYEFHETIEAAIQREKQIKKWKRSWKENLIKSFNPQLKDLWNDIEGCE